MEDVYDSQNVAGSTFITSSYQVGKISTDDRLSEVLSHAIHGGEHRELTVVTNSFKRRMLLTVSELVAP